MVIVTYEDESIKEFTEAEFERYVINNINELLKRYGVDFNDKSTLRQKVEDYEDDQREHWSEDLGIRYIEFEPVDVSELGGRWGEDDDEVLWDDDTIEEDIINDYLYSLETGEPYNYLTEENKE